MAELDLLSRLQQIASALFWPTRMTFTPEGGLAFRLLNKTGVASVKGTVVAASTGTDNAFMVNPIDNAQPIGVVYESGIADGSLCWVVLLGRCQVLIEDGTTATKGYWVHVGSSTAGRADITLAAPPGGGIPELDDHMNEIGHGLESIGSGTDVLAYVTVHFN